MLVRLGVGGLDPAFMAAGSSPSISSLRRRLDMLHHLTFTGSRSRVIWLFVAVLALTLVPLRLVARAPLQPQVPSTAAPALAGVEAEQATAPSPVQEIAQTTPAAPRESTDAFLALATEDARRQAEAAYRKAVEAEYQRTALLEGTADFLKKEYETKLEEYKAALVDFAGNQEPGEANQARQQALALQQTEVEQLRRKLEDVERTMRAVAEARQKAEQAGQDDAAARVARLNEVMRTLREQVGARETQAGVARQLEALAIAQQSLIEQLKNLAAQQNQLSTMQRQLSDQMEIIRRELERTRQFIARPPAAAPGTAAPAK
jgi:chromosome segregation ATPase